MGVPALCASRCQCMYTTIAVDTFPDAALWTNAWDDKDHTGGGEKARCMFAQGWAINSGCGHISVSVIVKSAMSSYIFPWSHRSCCLICPSHYILSRKMYFYIWVSGLSMTCPEGLKGVRPIEIIDTHASLHPSCKLECLYTKKLKTVQKPGIIFWAC